MIGDRQRVPRGRCLGQPAPQRGDVHVEGLGRPEPVLVPDVGHQRLPAHRDPGFGCEPRQQVELLGAQAAPPRPPTGTPPATVDDRPPDRARQVVVPGTGCRDADARGSAPAARRCRPAWSGSRPPRLPGRPSRPSPRRVRSASPRRTRLLCRSSRHTSTPSMSGSPRSSSTRSNAPRRPPQGAATGPCHVTVVAVRAQAGRQARRSSRRPPREEGDSWSQRRQDRARGTVGLPAAYLSVPDRRCGVAGRPARRSGGMRWPQCR